MTKRDTDSLRTDAALYALGALAPDEARDFERRLAAGDAECRRELDGFRAVVDDLGAPVPGASVVRVQPDEVPSPNKYNGPATWFAWAERVETTSDANGELTVHVPDGKPLLLAARSPRVVGTGHVHLGARLRKQRRHRPIAAVDHPEISLGVEVDQRDALENQIGHPDPVGAERLRQFLHAPGRFRRHLGAGGKRHERQHAADAEPDCEALEPHRRRSPPPRSGRETYTPPTRLLQGAPGPPFTAAPAS